MLTDQCLPPASCSQCFRIKLDTVRVSNSCVTLSVSSFRFGKDEYLVGDILHGAISGLTTEFDVTDVSINLVKRKLTKVTCVRNDKTRCVLKTFHSHNISFGIPQLLEVCMQ